MKPSFVRKFLPILGAALLLVASPSRVSAARTFAVWLDGSATDGGNAIPTVLNTNFGAGAATLISTADLETPGFLNSFSALVMSRYDSSFGISTISATAIANIQLYVGLAGSAGQGGVAVFTNDAADTFISSGSGDPVDANTTQLFVNAATFAADSGHGFIGEFNGAAMAFETNANGSALNLLQGNAGRLGFLNIGKFVYAVGPVGGSNPIDAGVTFPFQNDETSTYGMVVTGANPNNIVDVYSAPGSIYDNIPAVVANTYVISGGNPGMTPVPEASTYGLCGTVLLAGLAGYRRLRRKQAAV